MKIAVIAPTALPSRRANTIQVMKMAQGFRQNGHEVAVLAPDSAPSRIPIPWGDLASHYGLNTEFSVDWLRSNPRWRGYDYGRRAAAWARRSGMDLAYTRHAQAAAAAALSGYPTILEVHDLPGGRAGPLLFRIFMRGRGARGLVVITKALLQALEARFSLPAHPFTRVAPDGVDLDRYRDLPDKTAARRQIGLDVGLLSPGAFVAGYTGSLYPGRGIGTLLELAGRLPDMHFLLVGGQDADVGRVRNDIRNRVLANVTVVGFVPNARLPLYQAASDALLMPYQERVAASSGGDIAPFLSPMKCFEYLASGRAILSSDLPVLREVLNGENAVLLPPGEIAAWERTLRDLQEDEGRRLSLGQIARRDAEKYSWRARAAAVLEGV